jgi:hypothetical protein
MRDIPPLVDDAIAFAKCEGLDAAWVGWCERGYETGGQQSGLSKEESGRALLARCGNVSFDPREKFKDTLEKRIIEAVDSKKWVLKAPSGEPISPDLITSGSLGIVFRHSSFDFDTGCIVLIDGTRVPRVRLVRAEPAAPATTLQAVAPAARPQMAPATPSQEPQLVDEVLVKALPSTDTMPAKTRRKRFAPATYEQVKRAMQRVSRAAAKAGERPPDENEFHRRVSALLEPRKLSVPWGCLRPIYRDHYMRRRRQKD